MVVHFSRKFIPIFFSHFTTATLQKTAKWGKPVKNYPEYINIVEHKEITLTISRQDILYPLNFQVIASLNLFFGNHASFIFFEHVALDFLKFKTKN